METAARITPFVFVLTAVLLGCPPSARHPDESDPSSKLVAEGESLSGSALPSRTDAPEQTPPPERIAAAEKKTPSTEPSGAVDQAEERAKRQRLKMVQRDLQGPGRDITDRRVLAAMSKVPRHRFVRENLQHLAYADRPLPIGKDQTISQPYIVALMTQLARPKAKSRVLDVGTGSGYQAAVLAELVDKVYSIEIIPALADEARKRLKSLGYKNVEVRCGDGYRGWLKHAPFDAIIVAAAPTHVPQPLIEQLAPGGRLVIPVGDFWQNLLLIEKQPDGTIRRKTVIGVRFVPMTGEAEKREK